MVISVGILGCTGTVGQRFIVLLQDHPYFKINFLGASERSAGKKYSDIVRWKLTSPIPASVSDLQVLPCESKHFAGCQVIFSALDSSVAGPFEEEFASNGFKVFSNAKDHRMDLDVPILIPYVNPDHISIIKQQQKNRGWEEKGGFIVTNANCSSTGLVIALKPLLDKFGIEKVNVITMQAISGAGYPGVPSLDIIDNVVPFISGEEDKLETEPNKILASLTDDCKAFGDAGMIISAQCNRVPVIDGHTECVSVSLKKKANLEDIIQCFQSFTSTSTSLPSSPSSPLQVFLQNDRPQPRLDRDIGRGYTSSVGRIRPCKLFDYKFVLLSHNCVIGAAGGSILNAELAVEKGFINL
eukprot:TRINITY_DN7509_c0_g1_i1.p1 TRINITY_DN7509_c0_g1~~TRINITY_DN7509_c0_g1_i1.p1  ORF type:complete len:355 (-),score=95.91 TRINITY_DN7509_c0_g1_i1:35-1099(-)